MDLTPEWQKFYADNGVSPETHDYDAKANEFVPRAQASAPVAKHSQLEAFTRPLASRALPSVAGVGGFAAGAELGLPTAPFTFGVGPVVTGLIGAGLANYGASKAQGKVAELVAPEATAEWRKNEEESSREHPKTALAGEIATGLIGNRAGLAKNVGALKSIVQNRAVDEAAKKALLNVGMGAALGGSGEAVREKMNNEDLDLSKIALGTAGGAAITGDVRKPLAKGLMKIPGLGKSAMLNEAASAGDHEIPPSNLTPEQLEAARLERMPKAEEGKLTPDAPESFEKQALAVDDPASTRKAMLVPEGSEFDSTEYGLASHDSPHGKILYNPEKISKEEVINASSGSNELDGTILGFAQKTKPVEGSTVVTTLKDGVPVQDEVVAPGGEQAAAKAGLDAVPGGKVVERTPEEVLSAREDSNAANLNPSETNEGNTKSAPFSWKDFSSLDTNGDIKLDVDKMHQHIDSGGVIGGPIQQTLFKYLSRAERNGTDYRHPLNRIRLIDANSKDIGYQGKFSTKYGSNKGNVEIVLRDTEGNTVSGPRFLRILNHELLHNAVTSKFDFISRELRDEYNNLFNFVRTHEKAASFLHKNPLKNVHEFVSDGLTNKPFRELLQSLDYTGSRSMVDRGSYYAPGVEKGSDTAFGNFLYLIKKTLGMPKTLYDRYTGKEIESVTALEHLLGLSQKSENTVRGSQDHSYSQFSPKVNNEDGNNPRPISLTSSTADQLRLMGPDRAMVGDALKRAAHLESEYAGKYRTMVEPLRALSEKELSTLQGHLHDEMTIGHPLPTNFNPRMQKAYDAWRRMYKEVGLDQIADEMLINGRKRGIDPSGFPTMQSREVADVITQKQGSPEAKALLDEFFKFNTDRGVNPDTFNAYLEQFGHAQHPNVQAQTGGVPAFAALTRAEGTKLPKSWVEKNFLKATEDYIKRAAKTRAAHVALAKDDQIAGRFGFRNVEGVQSLGGDDVVKRGLADFVGQPYTPAHPVGGAFAGLSKVIHSALISNPISRGLDAVSTIPRMLSYVSPQHMPSVMAGLKNSYGALETAKKNGFIMPDSVAAQVLGGDGGGWQAAANSLAKISGSQALETTGRVLAQAMGESVAGIHVPGALAGDKTSLRFMNNLGPDWRTLASTPEGMKTLGTRIGKLAQGTYDSSNLPSWMHDSAMGAFFPLARWSIEQSNNFKKLAIDPLIKDGDAMPLITQLVVGLGVGGAGLTYVKEKLSGKKAYDATMAELQNAPNKERAVEGLVNKLMSYAQITGTGGMAMSLGKAAYDSFRGAPASGAGNPTASWVADETRRVAAAVSALNDGARLGDVMGALMSDMVTDTVGLAKFAKGQLEAPDKRDEANERRDFKIYKDLSGEPRRSFAPIVSYKDVTHQRLDDAELKDAPRVARELTLDAVKRNKSDPVALGKELRALATQRAAGIGPSVENTPELAKYIQFLQKTKGREKAAALVIKLFLQSEEKKLKRSLVPQLD
jgi:hypothetical protein